MAASFGAATASAAAASVTENSHKSSTFATAISSTAPVLTRFLFVSPPSPSSASLPSLQSGWNCSAVVRARSNEVAADGSSKTAASTTIKSKGPLPEARDVKSNEPPPVALGSEESISEFISQVASLVKLVDSKDIAELQLKQLDCELLIRKKEALSPPPAPVTYVQSQTQPTVLPPVSTPSPVPAAAPSPSPTPAPATPKAQPSKSSHPPLKCPMAGTFYRSPAPGEPPFVKVGDKVKKGQVLCIIEAMKLMNEIEADQSGTIVEILAEDGKPVRVDTPLFVIEP